MKREYIIPDVELLSFVSDSIMENISAGGTLGGISPEEIADPEEIL